MSFLKKMGIKVGVGKAADYVEERGWARKSDRESFTRFLKAFLLSLFGLEEKKPVKKQKRRVRRTRRPFRK